MGVPNFPLTPKQDGESRRHQPRDEWTDELIKTKESRERGAVAESNNGSMAKAEIGVGGFLNEMEDRMSSRIRKVI